MSKLFLNAGDKVRNINSAHHYYQRIGEVLNHEGTMSYAVLWNNGSQEHYYKGNAHEFLEKVDECNPASAPKCDQTPQRKLIKRDRINVVNGKTQDGYVRELGSARGVQQFNTRCLGRTTGQAFLVIGQAMCNPGTEIRISKVDHAKAQGQELSPASWKTLDERFRGVVERLLGSLQGFSFTDTHLVYHPIQTVETYVEQSK